MNAVRVLGAIAAACLGVACVACAPETAPAPAQTTAPPSPAPVEGTGAAPSPAPAPPATERAPFPAFEVVDRDDPAHPSFVFSSARATQADPVTITKPGRALREADRVNRVDLQKYWLGEAVPATYQIQGRASAECGPVDAGPHPACDVYAFVDPATGQTHLYFIYIGNWP